MQCKEKFHSTTKTIAISWMLSVDQTQCNNTIYIYIYYYENVYILADIQTDQKLYFKISTILI
jgi:hypothetical protein